MWMIYAQVWSAIVGYGLHIISSLPWIGLNLHKQTHWQILCMGYGTPWPTYSRNPESVVTDSGRIFLAPGWVRAGRPKKGRNKWYKMIHFETFILFPINVIREILKREITFLYSRYPKMTSHSPENFNLKHSFKRKIYPSNFKQLGQLGIFNFDFGNYILIL